MSDLRELLRQTEPDEAAFEMADVHARAGRMRARRRRLHGLVSAVVVVAVIGAGVLAAQLDNGSVRLDEGPAPSTSADPSGLDPEGAADYEAAPPTSALRPDGLWLSHDVISAAGQPIFIAVVSVDGPVSYGVGGAVQRWEDGRWVRIGDYGQATPEGFDTTMDFPAIGLGTGANGVGAVERSRLPPLEPGWYRIGKLTSVGTGTAGLHTATFQVVDADAPIAPVIDHSDPVELIVEPNAMTVDEAVAGTSLSLRRLDGSTWEPRQVDLSHHRDEVPDQPSMSLAEVGDPGAVVTVPLAADLAPGVWTIRVQVGEETLTGHLAVIDPAAAVGGG